MKNKDKWLIIVTTLLVIVLLSKSLFLDEVKPKNVDEERYKQFVEKRIMDGKENLGLLSKTGLTTFRVVKITKVDNKGATEILYLDGTGNYVSGTIEGQYKAKVRGYLLSILPYKEFTVEVVPTNL